MTVALIILAVLILGVVGAVAFIWTQARRGVGILFNGPGDNPIVLIVPHPETGKPWRPRFRIKFNHDIGRFVHRVFGHHVVTLLIKWVDVFVNDATIAGATLCHEVAGHGQHWTKYGRAFIAYYFRPFLFKLQSYLENWAERGAEKIEARDGHLWPNIRLNGDGSLTIWYSDPEARRLWAEAHGITRRVQTMTIAPATVAAQRAA